jgi:hypothetical protein
MGAPITETPLLRLRSNLTRQVHDTFVATEVEEHTRPNSEPRKGKTHGTIVVVLSRHNILSVVCPQMYHGSYFFLLEG